MRYPNSDTINNFSHLPPHYSSVSSSFLSSPFHFLCSFVRMTDTSIRTRAWMPFFLSAFIFILINSICAAKSPPEDLIRSLRSSSSPLILPLVLSTNSSPPSVEGNFRRQLQKEMHRSDNARMRLYDDLLTNGYLHSSSSSSSFDSFIYVSLFVWILEMLCFEITLG